MKATLTFAATLALALTASVASAQNGVPPLPVRSPALVQHHASTFEEGIQRGAADRVRAAGEYNYNTALAAIHAQTAVSKYLDNQIKRTQTYFEKRRINRQARAAERGPRSTTQQRERISKSRTPQRLTAAQYNRALGRVAWPEALKSPQFAAIRTAIDGLVKDRAASSAADRQIQMLAGNMKTQLKTQIRQLAPADYMAAKTFLSKLQYETQFRSPVPHVALSR